MEFRQAILAIRPDADVELLGRAYDVAAWCHQDQKRYSGDPYITHPAAVATILAQLGTGPPGRPGAESSSAWTSSSPPAARTR